MADDPVVAERGVLTAPSEAWDLAVRWGDMVRGLARQRVECVQRSAVSRRLIRSTSPQTI